MKGRRINRAATPAIGSLKDYYQTCAFAKNKPLAKGEETQAGQRRIVRKAADAREEREAKQKHRSVVRAIFRFWSGLCAAKDVSPVCTTKAVDPHELISRGAGGKVSLENSVAVCRECHHELNGKVGGNRLKFNWLGKEAGQAPRANIRGNVWAEWKGRR